MDLEDGDLVVKSPRLVTRQQADYQEPKNQELIVPINIYTEFEQLEPTNFRRRCPTCHKTFRFVLARFSSLNFETPWLPKMQEHLGNRNVWLLLDRKEALYSLNSAWHKYLRAGERMDSDDGGDDENEEEESEEEEERDEEEERVGEEESEGEEENEGEDAAVVELTEELLAQVVDETRARERMRMELGLKQKMVVVGNKTEAVAGMEREEEGVAGMEEEEVAGLEREEEGVAGMEQEEMEEVAGMEEEMVEVTEMEREEEEAEEEAEEVEEELVGDETVEEEGEEAVEGKTEEEEAEEESEAEGVAGMEEQEEETERVEADDEETESVEEEEENLTSLAGKVEGVEEEEDKDGATRKREALAYFGKPKSADRYLTKWIINSQTIQCSVETGMSHDFSTSLMSSTKGIRDNQVEQVSGISSPTECLVKLMNVSGTLSKTACAPVRFTVARISLKGKNTLFFNKEAKGGAGELVQFIIVQCNDSACKVPVKGNPYSKRRRCLGSSDSGISIFLHNDSSMLANTSTAFFSVDVPMKRKPFCLLRRQLQR
ncbi:hypothetical protein niasHT_016460 [Heterodera trifolii]|uniref:Uncharacterized protein n=1 Tax=Heterodera trifolii TaxID=157864 RepID=A0ABD2KXD8_9BILA